MKRIYRRIFIFFKGKSIAKYLMLLITGVILFVGVMILFPSLGIEKILSSFAGAVLAIFTTSFYRFIDNLREDKKKINKNLEALKKTYKKEEYYKHIDFKNGKFNFLFDECFINKNFNIKVVDDPLKTFDVDELIKDFYFDILKAHSCSYIRNEPTIRLDDFIIQGNDAIFYTSRSTYFHHMVTNRAMDFPINGTSASIRELYEYKSELTKLSKSKLSNHIGINALVFLNDNIQLMPLRSSDATISKRQITSGIASRLVVNDYNQKIDKDQLIYDALKQTIEKKLFFTNNKTTTDVQTKKKVEFTITFLGFGRNIYEGGKPEFFYTVNIKNYNAKEYIEMYKNTRKVKDQDIDLDSHIYLCKNFDLVKGKELLKLHVITHNKLSLRRKIKVQAQPSFYCNYYMYMNQ